MRLWLLSRILVLYVLCFIGVYGPPSQNLSHSFIDSLYLIIQNASERIILGGDFNLTKNDSECSNCRGSPRDSMSFSKFIVDNDLVELPIFGSPFTWTNNQIPPALAKLDRIFINSTVLNRFLFLRIEGGSRQLSDHTPLILRNEVRRSGGPRPFRLEAYWFLHQDFIGIIQAAKAQLDHLYHTDDIFWRQRTKKRWLKEGDRNTRYFQQCATLRQKSNWISNLITEYGVICDQAGIAATFRSHFIQVLGRERRPLLKLSHTWKNIVSLSDIFRSSSVLCVGDGRKVRFWFDKWTDGPPLNEKFPCLFALASNPLALIADLKAYNTDGSPIGWNIQFTNFAHINDITPLLVDIQDFLFQTGDDIISWRLSPSAFTTCSLYQLFNYRGITDPRAEYIWSPSCPRNISIMNWFAKRK
ncbi:hypothetical protein Cni_G15742 [Canna indica]|uniref:Endonuclease/exonuclease/phosphatase domain-containing protein n=1 Tax=Canna indica TaxID=4628 RepID=A0AAQ3KIE9_9LILI|nr:hypothetical protein Cni_G15742 [Canna indica]